ncbi:MAG: nuclear transport factor 2 family protein [Verrucomicrobia bacterium]|nr:nuclear transport factor 2 family protein [Verrucomicrobiota bacterium]
MEGCFAVSLVFVRGDAEWRLLHSHYSAPSSSRTDFEY